VYGLAFHVDYWDELGWRDPFSAGFATSRQRDYARAAGHGEMYTPQMVVNGLHAFVGSSETEARAALREELARPANAKVTVSPRWSTDHIAVDFRMAPATPARTLGAALVQASSVIHVKAGENAGKTLRHSAIVREFRSVVRPAATGTVNLPIPAGVTRADLSVVVFVQDPATLKIEGVARAAIPESGSSQ
jgi:hypothetical protein